MSEIFTKYNMKYFPFNHDDDDDLGLNLNRLSKYRWTIKSFNCVGGEFPKFKFKIRGLEK